jgi:hexulose-6-phosphate isomerase
MNFNQSQTYKNLQSLYAELLQSSTKYNIFSIRAERDVYIGIENVWNKFLLSPLEMRNFIDEVGSGYVGSYFDVGNVLQYSYPEYWIEILGKRIKKVHIKDFDTSIGNINGFKPLLQGDVNWRKVVKALMDVEYDSFITAELSPYKTCPEQLVYDTSRHMDEILKF